MIFIALMTASLLAGTVGLALSGDSIDDEADGTENENDDMYSTVGNGEDDYRGSFDEDEADGQKGDDLLSSYHSDDDLEGGEGDDQIAGGAEDDLIHGREGNDTLSGGTGSDRIYGDEGDDRIIGSYGDDKLYGGEGEDLIFGEEGADFIVGGHGLDVLRGGKGNDQIIAADIFREELGSDDVWDATLQNVILYDDDEDVGDLINADEGDDSIVVGKNDVIIAGDGNDTITTGTWVNGELPVFTDYEPGQDTILVAVPTDSTNFETSIVDDGDDAIVLVDGMEVIRVTDGAGGFLRPDDVKITLTLMTERPEPEEAEAAV